MATTAIARETAQREAIATRLTAGTTPALEDLEALYTEAGRARPWRLVLRSADQSGLAQALSEVRARARDTLLTNAETVSTSALTNESARLAREGLRHFLAMTDLLDS